MVAKKSLLNSSLGEAMRGRIRYDADMTEKINAVQVIRILL